MTVTFPPEVEKRVRLIAAQKGLAPDAYLLLLVQQDCGVAVTSEPSNGESAHPTNVVAESSPTGPDRSVEKFKPGIQLPPGISGQDAINALKSEWAADDDPDSLNRAIAALKNRTSNERAKIRERVMDGTPAPLPIPAGKTIFDVIPRIRGKETDQEVFDALERLS
jgi:hypothetical protein